MSKLACDLLAKPAFVLYFTVQLKESLKDLGSLSSEFDQIPPERSSAYIRMFTEVEELLLGKTYVDSRRMTRQPIGRILFKNTSNYSPAYADVYLLTHRSGAALLEVWCPAPTQPLNAVQWNRWLDFYTEDSLMMVIFHALVSFIQEIEGKNTWSGYSFPVTIVRLPKHSLEAIGNNCKEDIVRLLFIDRSQFPIKPEIIDEVLSHNFCTRKDGLVLLSRRSGIDLHGKGDPAEELLHSDLPPRSSLPFLITLELLLLERAVLQRFYDKLSRSILRSVEELMTLKQRVLDDLEEYYGAITNANRFTDAVISEGEQLLGIADLYDAVMDRIETISFVITTRYQKRMTDLQFWLTVIFSAIEIGFIVLSLATWYYQPEATNALLVLAWTIGASILSGAILIVTLWKELNK